MLFDQSLVRIHTGQSEVEGTASAATIADLFIALVVLGVLVVLVLRSHTVKCQIKAARLRTLPSRVPPVGAEPPHPLRSAHRSCIPPTSPVYRPAANPSRSYRLWPDHELKALRVEGT